MTDIDYELEKKYEKKWSFKSQSDIELKKNC